MQTYVACEGEAILGTYFIKANQPGLGSHVCNAGYVTSPRARGKGVASAMCLHSQDESAGTWLSRHAVQHSGRDKRRRGAALAAIGLWHRRHAAGAFRHASLGYVDAYVMFKDLTR